eukprot:scaffold6508_cov37-Tisochrysis_lutea.AAC.3
MKPCATHLSFSAYSDIGSSSSIKARRRGLPLVTAAIQTQLKFKNSAPHFFWGLYFMGKHHLDERCAVGYVTHVQLDFGLGRSFRPGAMSMHVCRSGLWQTPT